MNFLNRFIGKKIDPRKWGLERATLDLLSEDDKAWVCFRYNLASEFVKSTDTVLDAACGSGFGSEILAKKAKNVFGVDISKEALDYAKLEHDSNNIKFIKSDVKKMPFDDNFFDISVGIETLEHLKDYEKYLSELKRVTKNNGVVMISTPRKKSEIPLTPFHEKEFTFDEFRALLNKYFVIKKFFGLKRLKVPIAEEVHDNNSEDFDLYLAVCRNLEYVKENYNDDYFKSVHLGILSNPVAKFHVEAMARSIIGNKVLTIGCGTGTYEREILRLKAYLKIDGTDIFTSNYLDALRKDNGIRSFILVKPSIDYAQPFKDDSYDTVYSSHVLEHIKNPYKFIMESIRITNNLAMHLVPINLDNPDHINFFKYGSIDNQYKTQEANVDLEKLCKDVVMTVKEHYPNIFFEFEIVNPRDKSVNYGNIDFVVKKEDRPDGLMPCFLIKFYKFGKK